MSLSDDQVRHIARLARIAIEPEESAKVLQSLNRVLELVSEISKVDTAGIEPMAHPLEAHLPVGQRLRPDEVRDADQRATYQSVAPEIAVGLYLVPKVIE